MYGIPSNLDLSFLIGATLQQVRLTPFQFTLLFDSDVQIIVEGEWELEAEGVVIDRFKEWSRQEPYHWHRILNRQVTGWSISPPISLVIEFDGEVFLRLFDSTENYESFRIEPHGVVV